MKPHGKMYLQNNGYKTTMILKSEGTKNFVGILRLPHACVWLRMTHGFLLVEFCLMLGIWMMFLSLFLLICEGAFYRIQNRQLIGYQAMNHFRNEAVFSSKQEILRLFFDEENFSEINHAKFEVYFPNPHTSILKLNSTLLHTPLTLTHHAYLWKPGQKP